MGTNQIKSIRRTKKLGPTINEHKNKKAYIKNWNLGALWNRFEFSLVGCWKETNKKGFWQKGKINGILTEGFLAADERSISNRVKVWVSKWVAADEGIISSRVRVWVSEGGEWLSVRVSNLGVWVSFLKPCLKVWEWVFLVFEWDFWKGVWVILIVQK